MMKYKHRKTINLILIICLLFNMIFTVQAADKITDKTIESAEISKSSKYCDFGKMYVGEDKYENFNRKMFNLNGALNKYFARPAHILWASIMPKYGMDRIQSVYNNIEYPKRLASCLLQKDFKGAKSETKRFLTNTTIGLGGLYDPAKSLFKIKPVTENMDQALAKCKVKSGPYLVMPVLASSSPRSLLGRAIEAALDPSVYLASPITSIIKFGFCLNRTAFMQPLLQMLETTYADPYDIAKKMYGMENYIKNQDLDRKDLLSTDAKILSEDIIANVSTDEELIELAKTVDEIHEEEKILEGLEELADGGEAGAACSLEPDIVMSDFKSQSPVVDSMRTALFNAPDMKKSMWNELSIWNRSFEKRIKTDVVSIIPEREPYHFRYILQKDKNSPLAIVYPSIGEGFNSHHSAVFAKLFYDAGYSVIMQGSHFQWEFVKSMPKGYHPGFPKQDAENLRIITRKIIDKLQKEHKCNFSNKVLIGTSFGAMETLFVGSEEEENNTLNIDKYIAISPPIELVYAIKQADKNSEEFDQSAPEVKHQTAITAAKVLQITKLKDEPDFKFSTLPFTEKEGKLIVSFLIRQKLSDLIFTIEEAQTGKKSDIYESINNMNFRDYAEKYLLSEVGGTLEDMSYDASLYSISDFLKKSNKYKIYHSLDDFFVNKKQIEQLKLYAPQNIICLSGGSHLGFLYRKEFLDELKKDISLN